MYLRTNIKLKANNGVSSEVEEIIRLKIQDFAYNETGVGVNFRYLIENIITSEEDGVEDTTELKELSTHSFFVTKEESDTLANMVEPLIPSTLESSFDYEFMKFYLGAKLEMYKAFLVKNPTLTLNDIELVM